MAGTIPAMRANGLVMLFAIGALVAAVITGVGSRGSAAGENASGQVREEAWGGEEPAAESGEEEPVFGSEAIILEREADGHFYADASINGQTIRMLVDTGATAIALSRADARRAGVGISIGMPMVVGQGAGGDVHGELVTLDRVSLGGAAAEEMTAVVLDGGEMSLLGQSFLSKFDSVEIKGDRMVLR